MNSLRRLPLAVAMALFALAQAPWALADTQSLGTVTGTAETGGVLW